MQRKLKVNKYDGTHYLSNLDKKGVKSMNFSKDSIKINPEVETERIISKLKDDLRLNLKKRGAVIGVSGGIDSSIVLALCVKALGPKKVFGVMMPEKDSNPDSVFLAKQLMDKFDVEYVIEDMTPALYGFETYNRRDEAIKKVFPEYNMSYKAKIGLPDTILEKDTLNIFHVTIIFLNDF